MKLKKLSLSNFRGFEQVDIDFCDDITVLAGINGSGKSSILDAIAILFSRALPHFTVSTSKPRSFDVDDIKINKNSLQVSIQVLINKKKLDIGLQKNLIQQESVEPYILLRKDNDKIEQKDIKDLLGNRILTGELNSSQSETHSVLQELKQSKHQPVVIFFSPKRHLPGQPQKLSEVRSFEISQAFSNALYSREVELREFMHWFRVQEILGNDSQVKYKTLESLRSVVTEFIPEFTNLRLIEKPVLRFLVEKNGNELSLHQLSDGERGLLAIIFDITRRLAIANPESSDPISEGSAIILIDEIELHLHPKWQRTVLRKLKRTFKNCQFIITTHSPQVLGQTYAEQLRLIYSDETEKVKISLMNQSFGMDSSWILLNIMGTSARDYKVERKLTEIYDFIDENKLTDAREVVESLKSEVGNFPDLQEASSLIDRLELLEANEEN